MQAAHRTITLACGSGSRRASGSGLRIRSRGRSNSRRTTPTELLARPLLGPEYPAAVEGALRGAGVGGTVRTGASGTRRVGAATDGRLAEQWAAFGGAGRGGGGRAGAFDRRWQMITVGGGARLSRICEGPAGARRPATLRTRSRLLHATTATISPGCTGAWRAITPGRNGRSSTRTGRPGQSGARG